MTNRRKDNTGGSNQYKSILREVEIEATNPFVGVFNKFFVSGRRLKPIVKKRDIVAFENVKECKIYVHIIKGENVPIRKDFLYELRQANNKERTAGQNQSASMAFYRATPNMPADSRLNGVQ